MTGLLRLFRHRRSSDLGWKVRHFHQLLMLTPSGFERGVADLFRDMGFQKVDVSGGSGDLGADITGKDEKGRSVVVQCKQYTRGHLVGSRDVQLFIGMGTTHHRAQRSIFVTTSRFTKPALNLARKHGIELIDGDRLADLIVQVRGEPEPESDLPVNVLTSMGVAPNVISLYDAWEVQEEHAKQRLAQARSAKCQCTREDAQWNVSGDIYYMYGELAAWCPVCGRPVTKKERAKLRSEAPVEIEPPPDWKPPKGWKKPS